MDHLVYYHKVMSKGIENFTIGEELFIVDYDYDGVKGLYEYLRFTKMKMKKIGENDVFLCRCKREYYLPPFDEICEFQKGLCDKTFIKVTEW